MTVRIVTVHGTGDNTPGVDGAKQWWEPESDFCNELRAAAGVPVEVEAYIWSGANSETDRTKAAMELQRRYFPNKGQRKKLERKGVAVPDGPVHFISHSHGGNIVLKTAAEALRKKSNLARLGSWTNIATPFFKHRVAASPLARYGLLGLLGWVLWVSVILLVFPNIFGIAWLAYYGHSSGESALEELLRAEIGCDYATLGAERLLCALASDQSDTTGAATFIFLLLLFFMIAGVIGGYFAMRAATRGKLYGRRRKARGRLKRLLKTRYANIYHDKDEAIVFLKEIRRLGAEIVPRRTVSAMVRSVVFSISAIASLAAGVFVARIYARMINVPNIDNASFDEALAYAMSPDTSPPAVEDLVMAGFGTALYGIFLAPVAAIVIYIIYSLTLRLPLEFFLHGSLNSTVRGAIKNTAFGNDVGGLLVNDVGHNVFRIKGAAFDPLPAELQTLLEEHVRAHSQDTLARAREVLSVSQQLGKRRDLATPMLEALSWDELAHTAYFRVELVRRFIIQNFLKVSGLPPAADFKSHGRYSDMGTWMAGMRRGDDIEEL